MKTWKRRLLIALLALLGLLLVTPALFIAALQHQGLRMELVGRVLNTVNDDLHGTIHVGSVEGSLLGQAHVLDLRIYDGRDNLAAHVDSASIDFSLTPLLHQHIEVNSLEAVGGTAVVRTYDDGLLNWLSIAEEDEPAVEEEPFDWPVEVHRINLRDIQVAYLDETIPVEEWEGLKQWRRDRADELDQARQGDQIANSFQAAFDASRHLDFALPRAPTTLWGSSIDIGARFAMRGEDIQLDLHSLQAQLDTDILPSTLPIDLGPATVLVDATTLEAHVDSLQAPPLAAIDDFELRMALADPDSDPPMPFETLEVRTPNAQLNPPLIDWATEGDLQAPSPLSADADARITADELDAQITLRTDEAPEPIVASVQLTDYTDPDFGYDAQIEAADFAPHHWISLDDLPSLTTSLDIEARGRGTDPNSLRTDLQAQFGETTLDGSTELYALTLQLLADDGRFSLSEATAETPYIDLDASAMLDLGGELSLQASTSPPASGHPEIPTPEEATLDLDLHIQWLDSIVLDDTLDPQFFIDELDTVDVDATWAFERFVLDEELLALEIGSSTGDLQLQSRTSDIPDEGLYGLHYAIDATIEGLRLPDTSLDRATINSQGSLELDPLGDDPLSALDSLDQSASVEVRGLSAPDLALTFLDLDLQSQAARGGATDLNAGIRLRGLRSGPTRVGNIQASTDGRLHLGDGPLLIDRAALDTRARVRDLRLDDLVIEDTRANADISATLGDLDAPLQSTTLRLDLETTSLVSPDYRVDSVTATIDASADLSAAATPLEMVDRFRLRGGLQTDSITLPEADLVAHDITLTPDLRGTLQQPRGTLDALITDINVQGEAFENTSATLTFARDHHQLALALEQPSGISLDLDAYFDLHDDLAGLNLLALDLETHELHWQTADDAHLRIRPERLDASSFHIGDETNHIFVDGHFSPGHNQSLSIDSHLDLPSIINGFYLPILVDDLPDIEGELQASLDLTGSHDRPRIDSALSLDDAAIDGHGPFSAQIEWSYADQRLTIDDLDLNAFGADVLEMTAQIPIAFDLGGHWELFTERDSSLEIQIWPQHLRDFHEPIPALNDLGIDGHFQGSLHWEGTLADPRFDLRTSLTSFQAQGELNDDFIDFRDVDLDTHISYRSTARGGEGLNVDAQLDWRDDLAAHLTLRTPLMIEDWIEPLETGDLDAIQWDDTLLHTPFEARARIPAIDLSRIPLENLQESNLAGRADLDFELGGTLADPEGMIDLDVRGAGWEQFQNINFELDADIRDQHIHFYRMDMEWNDNDIFSGQGRLPLPIVPLIAGETIDDIPFDFEWTLHDLPVANLSVIDYELARVPGYISASLELSGSLRDPQFEVDAGLFDTELGDRSTGDLALEVRGGDNTITLDGGLWSNEEPLITLDGQVPVLLDIIELGAGAPWQQEGDLQFSVEAQDLELSEVVPTRLVSDFVVDPTGLLNVGIHASGSWDEPVINGDIEIVDGGLTLPEFARGFDDIQARIAIDDQSFQIDHFEAHDGDGSINAAGSVEHEFFVPQSVDIQAETDTFNLVGFGTDFPLFVSARISINGELVGDPGRIAIAISDLEIILTDDWDRALHDTVLDPDIIIIDGDRRDFFAELFGEEAQEEGFLNLEISIVIARNAWARHPMGDVNFQADMVAEISGTSVSLTGSVDLLRGDLEFLGRRFDIRPSEITFTGNIPPNPRLQLEAHHQLDRVITDAIGPARDGNPRIVFNITGTALEPRLELQSDPAMTDTEILFVLMTGRPPDRSDIGRDEGVASQALSAVSGLFFGMLQDSFAGAVPVDVLRLEPAAAGSRGGRLEVGSYLTNDIFFSWRHHFGSDDEFADNVWRLEYHFLPRWMVEMIYTDLNEGELNLFWDAL